jgi:hypothetical protein
MLVVLVAATKILAVKAGTSIHPARLPCQPVCFAACLKALALVKVDFFLPANLP